MVAFSFLWTLNVQGYHQENDGKVGHKDQGRHGAIATKGAMGTKNTMETKGAKWDLEAMGTKEFQKSPL